MAEYIPFIQSDNNYILRVPLNDATYQFDVRWNSRDDAWYLDLYEDDRTPIASSLKVVLGAPLGRSLRYLEFFQNHVLMPIDTTDSRIDAAYDDLGGRIQVLHMAMSEFQGKSQAPVDRAFKKIAKVTVWRDTIPSSSLSFVSRQLTPGQQLEIKDMRIKFRVERSLTRTPNQCDVYVTNLSRDTRHILTTKPLSVQLDAGYDDIARLLFVGDLHFGMSEQKGPDWSTLMQVGDGDRAYSYARVNRSYKAGTTVRAILKDAAASMGLTLPKNLASDKSLDEQVQTGEVTHGPARDALTKLLAPYGYHWSVQNGSLNVLRDDEALTGSAILIDQAHNMIGTPEFGSPPRSGKAPHMRVKVLLNPEITPGDLVKVTSEAIDGGSGLYRAEKVQHDGDTHSTQWETTLEIVPF